MHENFTIIIGVDSYKHAVNKALIELDWKNHIILQNLTNFPDTMEKRATFSKASKYKCQMIFVHHSFLHISILTHKRHKNSSWCG